MILKLSKKKITVGFGKSKNRLAVDLGKGRGITFFAGRKRIEVCEVEKISLQISPHGVVCDQFSFKPELVFLRLGRNRFLAAYYMGEGKLHIVYLPDECEIECPGTSEFVDALFKRRK